ncbi:hypothetical protein E2C01_094494 [Portunus trituberculatus]|uniref:Uncharacterized protein n=1 Tax=Portunus trituberculatus TaxID=210409 RepID=A0A5B7JW94_PORTR|nr:hypothetical protein [Portunus trituberculatus]
MNLVERWRAHDNSHENTEHRDSVPGRAEPRRTGLPPFTLGAPLKHNGEQNTHRQLRRHL